MTREEVFSKVAAIIAKHFEINEEDVKENTNIKDDLNADSISVMEFVLELEDEFGTEISDEDAEQIETVGAAVDYIASHLA
ncbi:acyl carrier protein [Enterococcus cecorum]|uniref:Acyl carrier protein n=1 Tax=Enterococcus cecorum TaxID=44008 RepID=A0A200I055_9ENTE|nr:acyl carrier protein [Enterococcus cecorum]OUZ18368.1 acyl carrier protein [Enterococcus cecorum]